MEQKAVEMVTAVSTRLNISDHDLVTDLVTEAIAQVLDYTGQRNWWVILMYTLSV